MVSQVQHSESMVPSASPGCAQGIPGWGEKTYVRTRSRHLTRDTTQRNIR